MWSKWRCGRFSRNRLSANLSDFVGTLGQHRASYGDEWSSGVFHLCHNEVVFHLEPRLARSPSLSRGCSQHQQCSVPQIHKSTHICTHLRSDTSKIGSSKHLFPFDWGTARMPFQAAWKFLGSCPLAINHSSAWASYPKADASHSLVWKCRLVHVPSCMSSKNNSGACAAVIYICPHVFAPTLIQDATH